MPGQHSEARRTGAIPRVRRQAPFTPYRSVDVRARPVPVSVASIYQGRMRGFALGWALILSACATPRPIGALVTLQPMCPQPGLRHRNRCQDLAPQEQVLAQAQAALTAFRVDEARLALDAALAAGPHRLETLTALLEQRGIAAAYLDDQVQAEQSFARLLTIAPRHLVSYTLSPKATFLFEKVRRRARVEPLLEVRWPRDNVVGAPVPLELQLVQNPEALVRAASLYLRTRGAPTWQVAELVLPQDGSPARLTLPAVHSPRATSLELYVRGLDAAGNETYAWASPETPRELPLRYQPPTPWYRRWWVWAGAGTALAITTGALVYANTVEPPTRIEGSIVVP